MGRKSTVRNPDHPVNQINAALNQARKDLKAMSNEGLRGWIMENVEDHSVRQSLLEMPRHLKIKRIVNAIRQNLVEKLTSGEAEQE